MDVVLQHAISHTSVIARTELNWLLIQNKNPTQVEYATKAVENSGTALGVRCKDGVLLAVEKLLISKMLVAGSNR